VPPEIVRLMEPLFKPQVVGVADGLIAIPVLAFTV
jgi:hypothetical protein